MKSLMNLPVSLIEKLNISDLLLIKGGSEMDAEAKNDHGDSCTGKNNEGNICGGKNNKGGACGVKMPEEK